jgi:hypothetical protein
METDVGVTRGVVPEQEINSKMLSKAKFDRFIELSFLIYTYSR